MAVALEINHPDAGAEALQRDTALLAKLLSGQPGVTVQRPEDAAIAPGQKGAALKIGRLLVSIASPAAVSAVLEGLKVYVGRDSEISIAVTDENGRRIEVNAKNFSADEIIETADRLSEILAGA